MAVGTTVLHFIEETSISANTKADYHIGTPFVKTVDAAASLANYFPTGKEATPHILISIPFNLPIDGCMTLSSGLIEDDICQTV